MLNSSEHDDFTVFTRIGFTRSYSLPPLKRKTFSMDGHYSFALWCRITDYAPVIWLLSPVKSYWSYDLGPIMYCYRYTVCLPVKLQKSGVIVKSHKSFFHSNFLRPKVLQILYNSSNLVVLLCTTINYLKIMQKKFRIYRWHISQSSLWAL
jgi:hypothetical protein